MNIKDADVNTLDFNLNDVPSLYSWGGGGQEAVDSFKSWNFLNVRYYDNDVFICSSENGTGLGEYLTVYVIRQPCVNELLAELGGAWEYWFFKAVEQAAPFYDEQDDWFIKIVEVMISHELIRTITIDNIDYFLFSELCEYEKTELPVEILESINAICKDALSRYLEDLED